MLAFYTVLHLLLLFLQALPLNAAPESTSELCITERASIFYDVIPTSTRTVIKIISVVVEETITPAVTDAEDDFRWVFKPLSTRTVVKTITSAPVTTFTETTTTTTYKGDSRNFRWSIFYMTTATTTVPAPPGFRRPTPALVGKRDGHKLRQADARHSDVADSSNQMIVDVHRKRAPAPCRVICTAFTTVNVTSTRTVLGALTATVPIGPATATLTGHRGGRVSTVVIPHDVLVPATTTVIEPTTITATVTKTEEKLNPQIWTSTFTLYEACLPTNILNFVGGNPIARVWDGPKLASIENFPEAKTPYDCCAACIGHGRCGAATFNPDDNIFSMEGTCKGLLTLGTCDVNNLVGYFNSDPMMTPGEDPEQAIHVSSGHCGHIEQGEV